MTLRQCRACKNQVNAESIACPVCGRKLTAPRWRAGLAIALLLAGAAAAGERMVVHRQGSPAAHQTSP